MDLDREVHIVGDLSHLVQQGIGSYLQTPPTKGKSKYSGRTPKISTKTIFNTESVTD